MHITHKPFDALSPHELYAILQLRSNIFVIEQQCIYADLDDIDLVSSHILAYDTSQKTLIGTARIYASNQGNIAHFGRICLSQPARGKQFGVILMDYVLQSIIDQYPQKPIVISAQYYLQRFYEKFGFLTEGTIYDEDGIDHIKMVRV